MTFDSGRQTADGRPQTADGRPQTADRHPPDPPITVRPSRTRGPPSAYQSPTGRHVCCGFRLEPGRRLGLGRRWPAAAASRAAWRNLDVNRRTARQHRAGHRGGQSPGQPGPNLRRSNPGCAASVCAAAVDRRRSSGYAVGNRSSIPPQSRGSGSAERNCTPGAAGTRTRSVGAGASRQAIACVAARPHRFNYYHATRSDTRANREHSHLRRFSVSRSA